MSLSTENSPGTWDGTRGVGQSNSSAHSTITDPLSGLRFFSGRSRPIDLVDVLKWSRRRLLQIGHSVEIKTRSGVIRLVSCISSAEMVLQKRKDNVKLPTIASALVLRPLMRRGLGVRTHCRDLAPSVESL